MYMTLYRYIWISHEHHMQGIHEVEAYSTENFLQILQTWQEKHADTQEYMPFDPTIPWHAAFAAELEAKQKAGRGRLL